MHKLQKRHGTTSCNLIGTIAKNCSEAEFPKISASLRYLIFTTALIGTLPTMAVVQSPVAMPWLRLPDAVSQLRIDDRGEFIAFVPASGVGLNVMKLATQEVFAVTDGQVGSAFFWAPYGARLFYRAQRRDLASGQVRSEVGAYDSILRKRVDLDKYGFPTGVLTLNPRTFELHLLYSKGVIRKKLLFPDERLARWQSAQRKDPGDWVVSQKGVLRLNQAGMKARQMEDDGSGVESFTQARDGSAIAWSTNAGKVYVATSDGKAQLIGEGRDPSWHPTEDLIAYAATQKVGNKAVDFDLRVVDSAGIGRYLSRTQFSAERWPAWHPNGKQLVYTKDRTSDLYLMDVHP